MTTAHEAIAALPVLTAADKALIRAMCTRRFSYCLTASESATDFVAVDPASGTVPLYLIQNSTMFAYDSTDSTTAHDGVTCLVSSDGKRFKSGTIAPPYSVLDKDTTAQPGSPTVGDRYLIPAAATGTDWAGKDGKIGIYTAAGWRFAISPVGRLLYVEDETAIYHRNTSGVWTAGVGSITLGAASIPITAIKGAKASFIVKVENQTTNAPPASPVAPVAYIIGPTPTGAWAGNVGKLAVCLVDGTFTIIAPTNGDSIYDKALHIYLSWRDTAWISQAGAIVGSDSVFTAAATSNLFGSTYFAYSSPTIGPASADQAGLYDPVPLPYTAQRAGDAGSNDYNLIFNYQCLAKVGNSSGASTGPVNVVVAFYRDSESTALDWQNLSPVSRTASTDAFPVHVSFEIAANDALPHNYTVRLLHAGVSTVTVTVAERRRLSVMERA